MAFQARLQFSTPGRGLLMITEEVASAVRGNLPENGILNLFIPHTSASLVLQENADPSARDDLDRFINRLVPDGENWHVHTHEGADDTTSHMKSAITQTSLNVPIVGGGLGLGTWQGIYLWEHREAPHQRSLILTAI